MAGSGVERKRKRKKVHHDSSESEGGADSGSDAEWNDEDNNAYLDFLQEFLFPGQSKNMEVNDDDEADPEYNIKEDEEEHDKEELRRDPAVKISKKELNELLAELVSDESVFPAIPKGQTDPKSSPGPTSEDPESKTESESRVSSHVQVPEEEKEDPVITEIVRKKITYQLQQHIQLLAQTYALTVISSVDEDRLLAQESKKMIIELHLYACSYGPGTIFRVKNIHYAANLVNSWPAPIISKSPIKKKILEERYRSQAREIYSGNGLMFNREVVKKIIESPAFMYSHMLPLYPHLHSPYQINFTPSEDALIAIGYREMQEQTYSMLKTMQKAKLVGKLLLPGRPVSKIFNRIKNARKKIDKNCKEQNHGLLTLRKYLIEGVPPPSPLDSWTPEVMKIEPVPPIDHPELPPTWHGLLQKLTLEMYDENAVKGPGKRPRTKKLPKLDATEGGVPKARGNRTKSLHPLNENKLCGTGVVFPIAPQNDVPEDLQRIPVLDKDGNPAAFVVIPKIYLNVTPRAGSANSEGTDNNSNSSCNTVEIGKDSVDITPIGQPFSLPQGIQNENAPDSGEIIDFQTLDSPLKREIFQMVCSSSNPVVTQGESLKNKTESVPACSTTQKITEEPAKRRRKSRKSADTSSSSFSVDKSIKKSEELSKSVENYDYRVREDHSARTWVYERKSAAEIAATIEKKLNSKKSRSKISGVGNVAPDVDVVVAGSSEEDEPEPVLTGPSFDSRGGAVGMSVPSLDFFESPARISPVNPPVIPSNPEQECPHGSQPTDSGDQRSDGNDTSTPVTDKSNKSNSCSSSRGNRGMKRDKSSKQSGGDGGGDDDPPERRFNFKPVEDPDHREEETEDEGDDKEGVEPVAAAKVTPKPNTVSKKTETPAKNSSKKIKRSPQSKKRIAKYKTAEIQKLLDEAESEVNVEAIEIAFAEEFWAKCQHTVDPVMYNNLIQVFCDFGERHNNEEEVFAKVEEMLKDYPDLLVDLATMIEPQLLQKNNLLKDNYVVQAYIRFMHLLEKLTLQCPQLRARVLQKIRGLRDLEKVTEKDVQELVDLYFQGNPIMTDALKAMFPAIFPPQSNFRPEDFEEINFDDESHSQSEDGMAIETVNLPEETNIPATSTCPCDCHSNTQNVTYHTKARHCRKCCIKFQDGKIFMHSGRFMKQVNIEFTTREKAEEILVGTACGHCFEPLRPALKVQKSPKRPPKKRVARSRLTASECESEPEAKAISAALKIKSPDNIKLENAPCEIFEVPASCSKSREYDDLEEGEIVDEDEQSSEPKEIVVKALSETSKPPAPLTAATVNKKHKLFSPEQGGKTKPWTFDEDKILLLTCQQEATTAVAFDKILRTKSLPGRTLEEIRDRFSHLVMMIMKTKEQDKKGSK